LTLGRLGNASGKEKKPKLNTRMKNLYKERARGPKVVPTITPWALWNCGKKGIAAHSGKLAPSIRVERN